MINTNDKSNVIKLSESQKLILTQLSTLIDQGKRAEEQLAPLLAIERGRLAQQLVQAIGGSILQDTGRPVGQYEFAPDFSSLTVKQAPGSVVPMMPVTQAQEG